MRKKSKVEQWWRFWIEEMKVFFAFRNSSCRKLFQPTADSGDNLQPAQLTAHYSSPLASRQRLQPPKSVDLWDLFSVTGPGQTQLCYIGLLNSTRFKTFVVSSWRREAIQSVARALSGSTEAGRCQKQIYIYVCMYIYIYICIYIYMYQYLCNNGIIDQFIWPHKNSKNALNLCHNHRYSYK